MRFGFALKQHAGLLWSIVWIVGLATQALDQHCPPIKHSLRPLGTNVK